MRQRSFHLLVSGQVGGHYAYAPGGELEGTPWDTNQAVSLVLKKKVLK